MPCSISGQMTQLVENNMLPVGTLVRYKGHDGFVNFVDVETGCMTICINTINDDPRRAVCLVVYKSQFDKVELIIGNHSRQD